MAPLQICVEAYGCSANIADSEMISGLLEKAGYRLVESVDKADLNIVLTCTVKSATLNKMIHRIRALSKLSRPMIVAGCMVRTELRTIESINPHASLLGPSCIEEIVGVADATLMGEKKISITNSKTPKILLPRVRRNPLVGIIEIASGCLSQCSFCQVKIAKEGFFSYPLEAIVQEVLSSIRNGCQEIWLTSQDNGCYGSDVGTNLPALLESLCQIDGRFHVRVGMINPSHVMNSLGALVDAYSQEKIFKFLHIPVQSGSDRVLKLMDRGYTVKDFTRIVDSFKNSIPQLNLSTDIIVGYPTESDKDFNDTIELLMNIQPDTVNISRFGPRLGTKASTMAQLDHKVVKKRSLALHKAVKEFSLNANLKWINWQGNAIIDEQVIGAVIARNFAYKPIILKTILPLGSEVMAKVVNATSHCLVGEVITPIL